MPSLTDLYGQSSFPGNEIPWQTAGYGNLTFRVFTNLAAADTDYIVDEMDISALSAGALGTVTLANKRLAEARSITLTLTDSDTSITDYDIDIAGWDQNGKYVVINFSDATETPDLTRESLEALVMIKSVTGTVNGASTADTMDIGFGTKVGVPGLADDTCIKYVDNATSIAYGTQTASATGVTINETYGTVIFGSAPDGTKDYELGYIAQRGVNRSNWIANAVDTLV